MKYLATDPKEKEFKPEPKFEKLETNSSIPQLTQTKSVYEKSVTNTEFHTVPDTYDDIEIPEKNSVSSIIDYSFLISLDLTEKSRSMSVDAYAKRKALLENGNSLLCFLIY